MPTMEHSESDMTRLMNEDIKVDWSSDSDSPDDGGLDNLQTAPSHAILWSEAAVLFWDACKKNSGLLRFQFNEQNENKFEFDGPQRNKWLKRRFSTVQEQLRGGTDGLYWWQDMTAPDDGCKVYPVQTYIAHPNACQAWCLGMLRIATEPEASRNRLFSGDASWRSGHQKGPPLVALLRDDGQAVTLVIKPEALSNQDAFFEGQMMLVRGLFNPSQKTIYVHESRPPPHPGIISKRGIRKEVDPLKTAKLSVGTTASRWAKRHNDESKNDMAVISKLQKSQIPIEAVFCQAEVASVEGLKHLVTFLNHLNCDLRQRVNDHHLYHPSPSDDKRIFPPAIIVLMGPFVSPSLTNAAASHKERRALLSTALTQLTHVLGDYTPLLMTSKIILMPGSQASPAPTFPAPPELDSLVKLMRERLNAKVGFEVTVEMAGNPFNLNLIGRRITTAIVHHVDDLIPSVPGTRLTPQITIPDCSTFLAEAMLRNNSLIPCRSVTRYSQAPEIMLWNRYQDMELFDPEDPSKSIPDATILFDPSDGREGSDASITPQRSVYETSIDIPSSHAKKIIVNLDSLVNINHEEGSYFSFDIISGQGRFLQLKCTSLGDTSVEDTHDVRTDGELDRSQFWK